MDTRPTAIRLAVILLIGVIVIAGGFFWLQKIKADDSAPVTERMVRVHVPKGATFSTLAASMGVATDTAVAILASSKKIHDLSTIRVGRELALVYDKPSNTLKKLLYTVDGEKKFAAQLLENGQWEGSLEAIPYDVRQESVEGVIVSSLYEAFLDNNLDVRLALLVAEMFAWQVDFAADIRTGDSFKVIYEANYLDGLYIMPGKILAAEFINDGEVSRGYYFKGEQTKEGYYDEQGAALQKEFLKSPLQYKYISSGYSTARVNPITKKVSAHRGIDYAANYGTPAVSIGDGAVTQAGWSGPYGISLLVRHNEMYTTRYGHFQSLAKGIRVGAKVKQGQVVGYVGSTGQSTGPHLHYEMHKFGSYVNPFKVEVPPGDPVAEADKEQFTSAIKNFQQFASLKQSYK